MMLYLLFKSEPLTGTWGLLLRLDRVGSPRDLLALPPWDRDFRSADLIWMQRISFGLSCFRGKYFTDWVISPARGGVLSL